MKYGLLKYRDKESNIGDYIQSLAALHFLPHVDKLVSREKLDKVSEDLYVILNGWFMHHPEHWPPSEHVTPEFISFHINEHAKRLMTNKKSIAYYKKHEPIGCRDKFTEKLLKSKGVDAYFSGCLTLTLEKNQYLKDEKADVIFCDILSHKNDVVDEGQKIPWKKIRNPHKVVIKKTKKELFKKKTRKLVKKLVPSQLRKDAIYVSNQNFEATTHEEKFEIAKNLLAKYAAAKLVVTSRIHVALPCLAFGTPVVFIHPERDTSRLSGLIELFHTFTIKQIEETPKEELQQQFLKASVKNKDLHLKLRDDLIKNLQNK
ncbi:polysaccharide pyruvyl transferase family protein [Xanthomarina sp. GH4-25]|uniref:polysaccharide pyruvyl transferase family protein n=1 Tax=Xanthomarina sp. GH4-25 TaxID=3349335 RepID=UPI000D6821BA|nr:polysaccharide pyruvyl transferase family protein [Flavobacteriaceae bacterium LYZ1037]